MASISCILERVTRVLEKIMYPVIVVCSVLLMPGRSIWLIMLFKFCVSMLIFCLVVLPIIESVALKFPVTFAELCFSLQFCQFLPHIFWDLVRYICL